MQLSENGGKFRDGYMDWLHKDHTKPSKRNKGVPAPVLTQEAQQTPNLIKQDPSW